MLARRFLARPVERFVSQPVRESGLDEVLRLQGEVPGQAGVAWMKRSLRSAIQVPPAMIIVWAIVIDRRASLPRSIAMQRRVLVETMIEANVPFKNGSYWVLRT